MIRSSKYFYKITFIILCSIAVTACTSSSTKKPVVKETVKVEQAASPSPSPLSIAALTPSPSPKSEKVLMENEAFRIFEPAPNGEIGTTYTVKGQARVFKAMFSYSFEDGHKVLAEGNVKAAAGVPEWGNFEFTITFEKPTNPVGALIIYEKSAKDGSPTNQLIIPLKFKADIIEALQ
jgi:hypothetical protein